VVIFRRRRKIGLEEVPDSHWAPPSEPDETFHYVRTPQPWPPPPPAPPAQPEPEDGSRAETPAAVGQRSPTGRVVAIGVAAAVVAAWVGVAVLAAPAHTKANTTGALDGTSTDTAAPQAPNGYGASNRRGTTGVVQSVDGATVTLLDGNGESVAIHTTAATTFVKTVPVSVEKVVRGTTIVASGVYSEANATLTAGRIAILDAGGGQGGSRGFPVDGGNYATGSVGAITKDHLILNLFDGAALTVLITPQVVVTAPAAGSINDLTRGKPITVRGQVGDNGEVDAYQIQEITIGDLVGRQPSANTGSLGLTPGRVVQS
jgi:hypothetical protein